MSLGCAQRSCRYGGWDPRSRQDPSYPTLARIEALPAWSLCPQAEVGFVGNGQGHRGEVTFDVWDPESPCLEAQRWRGCDGPELSRGEASQARGPGHPEAAGGVSTPGSRPRELVCPAFLSLQVLGLTFAMTMYCQVVKADTYCA